MSAATVHRWVHNDDVTRTRKRRECNGRAAQAVPVVKTICENDPFATCDVIQHILLEEHDITLSRASVHRAIRLTGYSFKRAARSHKHEQPDSSHPFMIEDDPYSSDVISIDESCFVSCDTPVYGWSPIGQPVEKPAPRSRSTCSVMLAISRHGVVRKQIIRGSFNGRLVAEFLSTLPRASSILLDNLPVHKSHVVRSAAAALNQTLIFAPPYCPWFNPVEHAFSIAKHAYRKRRYHLPGEPMELAIHKAFESVTDGKCGGCFAGAKHKWAEARFPENAGSHLRPHIVPFRSP